MYEKQTWKNGDVITEDKLNHMEEGISTGGGIYTYENTTLFDGEVTTVKDSGDFLAYADITLQGDLPKSDISVTFNGQDYTLPYGYVAGQGDYWGEFGSNNPSFTNYPLFIGAGSYDYMVATPEAGTYSLTIKNKELQINSGFKEKLTGGVLIVNYNYDESTSTRILDKTWKEIHDAYINGAKVLLCFIDLDFGIETYSGLVNITNNDGSEKPFNVMFGNGNTYNTATEDGYPDDGSSGDIH